MREGREGEVSVEGVREGRSERRGIKWGKIKQEGRVLFDEACEIWRRTEGGEREGVN